MRWGSGTRFAGVPLEMTATPFDWIQCAADLAHAAGGGAPVLWERLTWTGVRDLAAAGQDLAIVPIGATEQHGPHLPLGTDNAIATAACAYASAKTGVPMLPCMSYAVSVGHTRKWPGTVSMTHETFATALREIVAWLLPHGWKRLLLVNSHFGNDAVLRVAVDRLRTDYLGELQINAVNTFAITPEVWASFTADGDDIHANRAETDLMLCIDPDAVDAEAMGLVDDPDRTGGKVFSYPVALTSTNGLTGRPSEGDAERGRALLTQIGEALASKIEAGRTEAPPLPLDFSLDAASVPRTNRSAIASAVQKGATP
jgi:creatinine amidohydrolase